MTRKFLLLPVVAALFLGGCGLFGGSSGSSSKFCEQARTLETNRNSLFPSDATDSQNFQKAVDKLKELQKSAPSAIKGDVSTLLDALQKLQSGDLKALTEPGFSAKVQSASKNVQNYLTKTCKIKIPTSTTS